MRLVIDTNILVAAQTKNNIEEKLVNLCLAECIQPLITLEIYIEYEAILKAYQNNSSEIKKFYNSAELIKSVPEVNIVEDPDDNVFLECALGGSADYIISNDKHLLDCNGYEGVRICKASQFFEENPLLLEK